MYTEDEETARNWLNLPNRALGNGRPLELLDTDAGVGCLECTGCRADNHFVDIDIIGLGDGIQDGSGDRIRGECGLAEFSQHTLG